MCLFWIFLVLIASCCLGKMDIEKVKYLNRIMVKMKDNDLLIVQPELRNFNLRYVEKIIPGIFLFQHENRTEKPWRADKSLIQNLKSCCQGKVLDAVQEVESIKPLWSVPEVTIQQAGNKTSDDDGYVKDAGYVSNSEYMKSDETHNCATENSGRTKSEERKLSALKLQTYSDMGIVDAWSRGYTGKGVVIGITDVGIDVDHDDLSPNVDRTLTYNAFTGSGEVAPEYHVDVTNYRIADHGTNCASLIAALKNQCCGDGVAHGATIAGLKAFKIRKHSISIKFSDAMAAKCLSHAKQSIHIYSNSWSTSTNFDPHHFSIASQQALSDGVKQGRDGKGSIFVFPVGALADGYANSPYTVTVNGVGAYGKLRKYSTLCACVLTSAYGERSTNSSILETASWYLRNPKCTRSFVGTSASVAIVSGIIGLVLEANNNLTWRDIQHLLVKSSTNNSLPGTLAFRSNGAGKPYHPILGFGLLNASRMVQLAKTWKTVPAQKCHSQIMNVTGCSLFTETRTWICSVDALLRTNVNIASVEHVVAKVMYYTTYEHRAQLIILSPSGTTSILKQHGQTGDKATQLRNAKLMSVHLWGERVPGTWRVILEYPNDDEHPKSTPWSAATLTICGSQHHDDSDNTDTTVVPQDAQWNATDGSTDAGSGFPSWAIAVIVLVVAALILALVVVYRVYLARTRKAAHDIQQSRQLSTIKTDPQIQHNPQETYASPRRSSVDQESSKQTDSIDTNNSENQGSLQRHDSNGSSGRKRPKSWRQSLTSIMTRSSSSYKSLTGDISDDDEVHQSDSTASTSTHSSRDLHRQSSFEGKTTTSQGKLRRKISFPRVLSTGSHTSQLLEEPQENDSFLPDDSLLNSPSEDDGFLYVAPDTQQPGQISTMQNNPGNQVSLQLTDFSQRRNSVDQRSSQQTDSIDTNSSESQVSLQRQDSNGSGGRKHPKPRRNSSIKRRSSSSYTSLNDDISDDDEVHQRDSTASNSINSSRDLHRQSSFEGKNTTSLGKLRQKISFRRVLSTGSHTSQLFEEPQENDSFLPDESLWKSSSDEDVFSDRCGNID